MPADRRILLRGYRALKRAYGPQGWWPARSRFEVIVGAILTQNTSWRNVEKGLAALQAAGLLDPAAMRRTGRARLARLLRPTGYFNRKAARLAAFLVLLDRRHGGDLDRLLGLPADELRRELLAIDGIGPETADAIVLYAAAGAVFVVDAYARRILGRHAVIRGDESYEMVQRLLHRALPRDAALFNEYHALLVRVGKERCRKGRPQCEGCPLERLLPAGGPVLPGVRPAPSPRRAGSNRTGSRRRRLD